MLSGPNHGLEGERRMTVRIARSSVPALLLWGLAACGSGSEGQAGEGGPASAEGEAQIAAIEPCSLVTNADVAAAIGEKVVGSGANGDSCTYETEDPGASSVTIQVKPQGGADEMEGVKGANAFLSGAGKEMQGGEGAVGDVGDTLAQEQASPGVGDESAFDAAGSLHVRKGDAYLMVQPPIMRSRMSGGNPLLSTEKRHE